MTTFSISAPYDENVAIPLANMDSDSPIPSLQPLQEDDENDASTPKPTLILNEIYDDIMIPLRSRINKKDRPIGKASLKFEEGKHDRCKAKHQRRPTFYKRF